MGMGKHSKFEWGQKYFSVLKLLRIFGIDQLTFVFSRRQLGRRYIHPLWEYYNLYGLNILIQLPRRFSFRGCSRSSTLADLLPAHIHGSWWSPRGQLFGTKRLFLFVLCGQEADTSRQRKKEMPIYHNVWKAILYPFNLCFFHLGSYQLAKATIQWPNTL